MHSIKSTENEKAATTNTIQSIPTDATSNISIWSNVEASLGIAAGSLVTLRPLFRWFRDSSSMGGSKSKSKRTGGSMPLSSINGVRSTTSNPQYWRPDLDREEHTVITTVHTSNESEASRTSSQENLNPAHGGTFFHGVNVQKTFYVSEDQRS